ncbi:MAG: prolipoprotein diacylglyceryl transferase [Catonella sp.]|uniref:prolipoprotein diacylglyceryl transferase n=1 Tax=Catonella sp. TaxID=2382125 RepID=UPI003F9FBFE0
MFALDAISFPNLGIMIENLPKSISIFGRFDIAFYGIIIGFGIALGYIVASFQAIRTGQDKEMYLDFAMYAVIISIIGARIYYVVFSWDDYKDDIVQIFNLRAGGLAIYGGVIGGIVTGFVYSKIKKIKFTLLADTACAGLLTGQIIGRWGNFFNREAFGDYTDSLLAMRLSTYDVNQNAITRKMLEMAEEGGYVGFIQVHPTFLYESVWNLCLLVIILLYTRHKKFGGEIFLIYMGGYGLGRAIIEGLRTDQLTIGSSGIAVSQMLALFLFTTSVLIILYNRVLLKKNKKK